MNNNIWYARYLGRPWSAYQTGPESYDCWGFVVAVLRDHFGVSDLPRCLNVDIDSMYQINSRIDLMLKSSVWVMQCEPVEASVVLMGRNWKKDSASFGHIGLVSQGRVLHCRRGAGVCVDTFDKVRSELNFDAFEYWLHESLCQ